tara:strand:+ start:330 stop:1097 length:768 start_codon:yes stop_codon:yes gene_type:complete
MANVLPPEAGLKVQGVYHQYTITKDTDADATVSITNKHASGNGNIYELNDNWNKLPSNTKIGFDLVTPSLGSLWGEGNVGVTGDATLSDVTIAYNYKFDPCFIPLADPSCPDFKDALYQYLLDNNLLNNEPSINDPYYDEWVMYQLEQKTEAEELEELKAEKEKEEAEEELSMEKALSVAGAAEKIADPLQQLTMMKQMASVGTLDGYYGVTIEGGTYKDTVQLKDSVIVDNYKALRNLAQDKAHRTMVRSQYDK